MEGGTRSYNSRKVCANVSKSNEEVNRNYMNRTMCARKEGRTYEYTNPYSGREKLR